VISETIRAWLGQQPSYLRDEGPLGAPLPDYVVLYSTDLRVLYWSNDFRALRLRELQSADTATQLVEALLDSVARIPAEAGHIHRSAFGERIMLISQRIPGAPGGVSHVVAGTSLPSMNPGFGRVAAALLIVAPILMLISIMFGYRIAGRPQQVVERIINEVEAITDGRSLHKRLAEDHSSPEFARLALTLNEMMQRLEKSFSALRTFTADASHELNTPLAVLRADVERAMSPIVTDDERMVALEEALREIRRMTDLVDSLLTLARADEGRLDLHREPVELGALVHDVYETAQLLAEEAGLSVKLTTLEPTTVMGDEGRLRQLFLNLVTNAIKYTPKGGRVELSLSRRLDGIAFAVRDTGVGISAADLPHIFERFWRADRSRSRASAQSGFGLGLPIGSWIAHAHGGTLTAASKLGKGSTFTVTLPLGDGGELTTADHAAGRSQVPAQHGNPE
jgi:signal transduction histidine kinase